MWATIPQAAGLFAVTNIDDIVLLSLFFGRAGRARGGALRIAIGQYLGFGGILAVAVAVALGVRLLPEAVVPYFGVLPLLLGLRAAWTVWRERGDRGDEGVGAGTAGEPGALAVAAVTVANGGDNIAVYVPVFATVGPADLTVYLVVFLILVAVWCLAGRYLATRPLVARALARWGHVLLPIVLIGLGLIILVDGGVNPWALSR
ncbi:cadmium transporter [Pseudonocardia asaccharolytica DSM 44247 = NBRC 16224]|uniref:Cadmium transporter n=1 Tax=Pseudonocardia asaccharolytica DSM 44247 = NBRC 16224 TaxID=1123024 RepID=A0A511CUT2_9PSEU|nr:cadmium transporter [Pseudonocardia asaccharolytica DSM 44247 = NBRC 16224]